MLVFDKDGNQITAGGSLANAKPERRSSMDIALSGVQRLIDDPDLRMAPEEAAGVMGSLWHESGGFKQLQEIKPISGRGGFGWAQWTGPRRRQFEEFTKANNLDPRSDEANFQFLKHELINTPEGRVLAPLKQAQSAEQASDTFTNVFERPGVPALGSRRKHARTILAAWTGGTTPDVAPADGGMKVFTEADAAEVPFSSQQQAASAPAEPPTQPPSLLQRGKNMLTDVGNAVEDFGYNIAMDPKVGETLTPPPVRNLIAEDQARRAKQPELLKPNRSYLDLENSLQMNLNPQFVEQVKQSYEAGTPEDRQRLMSQPGEVGQVAKYIDQQYQKAVGVTSLNPALDGIGGRREDIVQRNLGAGMEPQSAQIMADREVRFPGAMKPTGQAQSTTFDFDRFNRLKDSGPVTRGVEQGVDLLKSQAAGLNKMAADLGVVLGVPGAAEYGRAQTKARGKLGMRQNEMGEAPTAFDRNLEGAIASTISNAPALVAGLFTGGEAIPLIGMGAQVAGDEYARGLEEGLTPQQSLARAVSFGAAEVLGEKIGFKGQLDLIKKASKGSWADFEKMFVKNMAEQVIGEEFTTAAEARIDGSQVGLNKELTTRQLFDQMKDTLYQTVLQTAIMGSPGAVGAGARSLKKSDTRYDQPYADAFKLIKDTPEAAAAYDQVINTRLGELRKDPEFRAIMENETDKSRKDAGLERGNQARQILAERRALRAKAPTLTDIQGAPAQGDLPEEDAFISSTGIPGDPNAQTTDVLSTKNEGREGDPSSTQEARQGGEGGIPAQTVNAAQGPQVTDLKPEIRQGGAGFQIVDANTGTVISQHPTDVDAFEALDQLNADRETATATQETTNEGQNQEANAGTSGQEGLLNLPGQTPGSIPMPAGGQVIPGTTEGANVNQGVAGADPVGTTPQAGQSAPEGVGAILPPGAATAAPTMAATAGVTPQADQAAIQAPGVANQTILTGAPNANDPTAGTGGVAPGTAAGSALAQGAEGGAGIGTVDGRDRLEGGSAGGNVGATTTASTANNPISEPPLERQPEQNTKDYWDTLDEAGKSVWAEELEMPEIKSQNWDQLPLPVRRTIKGVSRPAGNKSLPTQLTAKQESELRGQNAVQKQLGQPLITPEQYLASQGVQSDIAASNTKANDQDVIDEYNTAVDTLNAGGAGDSGGVLLQKIKTATALPRRGFVQRRIAESIAQVFGHRVVYIEHEDGTTELDRDGAIIGSRPDVILLNKNSQDTFSRVVAHELTHGLRRRAPKIYADMVTALREVYSPIGVSMHLGERNYEQELPQKGDTISAYPGLTDPSRNEEEWVSDFVSDVIHKPTALFRVAVAMNRQRPGAGGKFLRAVDGFMSGLIQKLQGAGFNAEAAIAKKDLQRARNSVTEALAQYANAQQTGTEPEFDGPEILESKKRVVEKPNTKPIPESLQTVNSIESVKDVAAGQIWRKGRDLKMAFDAVIRAAAKAAKVNLRSYDEHTQAHLIEAALKDAVEALRTNANAIGWYDKTVTKALKIMGDIHPELNTDPQAKFSFIWALAVTSNGLKVDKNFELADAAYAYYKQNGVMPTDVGTGTAAQKINDGLALFNQMMDEYGFSELQKIMTTKHTVRELQKKYGMKAGGEGMDTVVYGSAILGPKIGNGFFSNLYGNFDQLTMDRWLMRTWGRWTGNLVTVDMDAVKDKRGKIKQLIKMLTPEEKKAFEAAAGVTLSLSKPDETAAAIRKASMKPDRREAMSQIAARDAVAFDDILGKAKANAARASVGDELRKMGNGLDLALDGQNEAPSGAKERSFIRSVFSGVLKRLQKQYPELTMADLQALLWYPEKRLYDSAKLTEQLEGYDDDEAPDYANAAAKLAEQYARGEPPHTGRAGAVRGGERGNVQKGKRKIKADNGSERDIPASNRRVDAVHRARRDAAQGNEGSSGTYLRESRGNGEGLRLLRSLGVTASATWSPSVSTQKAFSEGELKTPVFHELRRNSRRNAQKFSDGITASKNSTPFGAAVYVYPVEDYQQMRLFLSDDGKSGVAVKDGGDIVSVFGGGGTGNAIMQLAISAGGKKLDAFDTVLPRLYSTSGFVAVARMSWNNDYAPDGWSKETFADFNNGEPDVVFMVYKPDHFGEYSLIDGTRFDGEDGYDKAVAAQEEALNEKRPDIPASNRRPDAARNERAGSGAPAEGRPVYGQTKRGGVRAVGVHFSGTERQELDGAFYGTGAKGEEADRVKRAADKRLANRIYFYINAGQGVSPEQGVGGNAHTVLLKNLYDSDADPLELYGKSGNTAEERMNDYESAILDAGFDGYVADFGNQRAAVLIGDHKVPVRFEGQGRPQVEPGERAEPNANKRLARLMGKDWSRKTPQAWGEYVKSINPSLYDRYAASFTGTSEKFWPDEMASRAKKGAAVDIPASNRRNPNPTFYSQLARGFESSKMNSMPGAQWRAWLFSNKAKLGIKDDEIAWTGIEDYLTLNAKEKLTKADIASYLADNGVQVQDVMKGGDKDKSGATWAALNKILKQEDNLGYDRSNEAASDLVTGRLDVKDIDVAEDVRSEISDLIDQYRQEGLPTKFSSYTIPGGQNYRELLITLPDQDSWPFADELKALRDIPHSDLTPAQAAREIELGALSLDVPVANYQSGHWDEKNVLAHLRFDERTDADGNKVMFIQEIQSDWGQEGKKKGFDRGGLPDGYELVKKLWASEFGGGDGQFVWTYSYDDPVHGRTEAMSTERTEEGARQNAWMHSGGGRPSISAAPFVTDTKSWVSLALKRAIRYAAENGFDKIAFANGQQNADLYDLSKQVEYINYRKVGDDKYQLEIVSSSGTEVALPKDAYAADELEDVIGKEIAQKIVNDEGERNGQRRTLRDMDLKVGGSGMRTFYDKIVPSVANDVLKKLGGGRVGKVNIPIVTEQNTLDVIGSDGDLILRTDYDSQAYAVSRENTGSRVIKTPSIESAPDQPGFTITPALRSKALDDGMPLFSNRRNVLDQPVLATWTTPDDSKLDNYVYLLQDKHIDTKRIVEKLGSRVSDAWDPYLKETLYHGRAAKDVDDFKVNEIKPLLQAMSTRGITIGELETFLHNRHAKEANEQIARINEAYPDGGSGILTQDAQDYLANLPAGKRTDLEAMAAQIDAITAGTRRLLVDSGLETQDTIDAWEATYADYVPLQRESEDVLNRGMGTGQGFSTKGPASKRRTGSGKNVVDIMANVMMQRERAITRAEKNKVGLALYGLAIQNPNPGFWYPVNPDAVKKPASVAQELVNNGMLESDLAGIIQEPTVASVNPRTGLVEYKINPALRNRDNVLAIRIKGKDRFLFFSTENERAVRMAQSLKNLDAPEMHGLLNAFRYITRYVSSINTQYNPIFGVVNLLRDTQGAMLNLSTTPIAGKQTEVAAKIAPAMAGIYGDLRADRKGNPRKASQWSKLWEEFQTVGGKTGYRDMYATADDRMKALEKELKAIQEGKVRRLTRGLFDWLSDYNETLENAVRLSAYKVGTENGMTKEQAAVMAKELTVNFNRKGQIASQAGALYAFFNAAVQGTARLAETAKGPAGKKIVAGGLIMGVVQAAIMAAAGYDDDEPPEFLRERNFIIPMPNGKYVSIPMPLGFHVLPNTGRVLTEIAINPDGAGKKIAGLLGSFFEAFNPIGSAGWSVQTIAPTFADPLVALSENRDAFGKEIAKKDRSATSPTPGFTRTKDTASWLSKRLAWGLNRITGGTDYTQGALSPTPDQLDYVFSQATGGVGREVMKIEQAASAWMTGEELPPYKYPLGVGRFVGDVMSQSAESNRFYANLTRLNELESEIKGRAKDGKDVAGFLRSNPLATLVPAGNQMERAVSELRSRKRKLIAQNAPKATIKALEGQIATQMKVLNDRVKAVAR